MSESFLDNSMSVYEHASIIGGQYTKMLRIELTGKISTVGK